ncbi:uncharacterized protein EV422DRAFT_537495 [Fimicolochytrium jonesii]|uniref:uncharacterized protein n=1 Tax=Fimicolochytrium jonesii TaxID=1396493 RepID=UPI0022FF3275|nr:uncharacterized protein EV422DRAFT_537495 [Fimicolochytrium jonesii]KAI8818562.1 hypothetical protein EV422DRAFT_537495 [Fimicolochytrium jonesii]
MTVPIQLSTGSLLHIYESDKPNSFPNAVVQVLNIKKITTQPSSPDRYRLIVSDGAHFMQAMLATQLNPHVVNDEIRKNGVLRMKRSVCNTVANKRIIIILEIEVLTPFAELPKQGTPINVDGQGTPGAGNQANLNQQGPAQPQQDTGHGQQSSGGQQTSGGNFYGGNGGNNVYTNSNASRGTYQDNNPYGGGNSGMSNMPPTGGNAPMDIFSIKALTPYQNRWTIKARVVNKSEVKHWDNARGSGKLFSCTFVDETGEIRATGFKEAVELFYDLLKEGKVYYISKAPIKMAKRQFSNVNNEYEMTLDPQSTVTECSDAGNIPTMRYSFVGLNSLFDIEANSMIDVIGVVKSVGELSEIISKTTQKPFKKRDTTIVDQNGFEVRMTLWGQQAETFEPMDNPVVAVKGVKLGDFGGRSLSLMGSSSFAVNPDIPEAHQLRGWYDSTGKTAHFQGYSNAGPGAVSGPGQNGGRRDPMKFISQIKDENLGLGEKPDYFMIRGTVMFIKNENISYPACQSESCNKKVTDIGNGWRCEKCDKTWPAPSYRYIMSFTVSDHTGQIWLQGFNDIGEAMLGKTADEMAQLKDSGNQAAYDAAFSAALFKSWDFKVRAKAETYQDEAKVRTSVMSFVPVDYASASLELADMIEQLKVM